MKGSPEVIAVLQEVLKAELTAINQYFLHGEMCDNWGYQRLAGLIKKEAVDEMKHAEVLIERILYLDATPNMTDYFKINVGETVPKQFENDLELEKQAVARLNRGIKTCWEHGDGGSRELLEHILTDEEHHIDWLEAQLFMIEQMGLAAYLAEQMKNGE